MRIVCLLLLASLVLSGCGLPNDPNGTLQEVEGGTLRAGVIAGEAHAAIAHAKLQRLAESLDASLKVQSGTTHELMEQLEHGELDIVAVLPKKTPYTHVALSKPVASEKPFRVWALPQGENAWLLRVNAFLANPGRSP